MLIDQYSEEVVEAAVEAGVPLSDVEECYSGKWASDAEFVQNELEETGCLPDDLPLYVHIDWESTARDVMMDYTEEGGHYFRNI